MPLMDVRDDAARSQHGAYGAAPAAEGNALWTALGALYRNWRRIAAFTAGVGVLAVALALALPREYAAEAHVLRAEGGVVGSLLGTMDRATGGLGRLLAGGAGADYTRSLAILHSRSLRERVVDEFALAEAYGLQGKAHPREEALNRLDKNVAFHVSLEYDYLAIIVYDREPERAAAMANFIVAELNRRNAALTSDNARQTREFIERRLREAEADLDAARAQMQAFQERHGIVEVETQAQAFLGLVATMRGRVAESEVRYQTLLQQYGPDNPQVAAARDALAAARAQVAGALRGGGGTMSGGLSAMPALSREYAELLQDHLIQAQIIETVYPLYEQARFQERSDAQTLQILDPAVAPLRPARPSRRLIVLVATLTGLFVACLFVVGQTALRHRHETWAARLSAPPSSERGFVSA